MCGRSRNSGRRRSSKAAKRGQQSWSPGPFLPSLLGSRHESYLQPRPGGSRRRSRSRTGRRRRSKRSRRRSKRSRRRTIREARGGEGGIILVLRRLKCAEESERGGAASPVQQGGTSRGFPTFHCYGIFNEVSRAGSLLLGELPRTSGHILLVSEIVVRVAVWMRSHISHPSRLKSGCGPLGTVGHSHQLLS